MGEPYARLCVTLAYPTPPPPFFLWLYCLTIFLASLSAKDIEDTLTTIYEQWINHEDLYLDAPGSLWCGAKHGFQHRDSVLYADTVELASAFSHTDVKFLWLPKRDEVMAGILNVQFLSQVAEEQVEYQEDKEKSRGKRKKEPFVPPLFSNVEKKALCCWHSQHFPEEWPEDGCPPLIGRLLSIHEERRVKGLKIVKCVNVNNQKFHANDKKDIATYINTREDPPVIFVNADAKAGAVAREFAFALASTLKLTPENTVLLSSCLQDVADSMKENPTNISEVLDELFPEPPPICFDESSSAYVVSEGGMHITTPLSLSQSVRFPFFRLLSFSFPRPPTRFDESSCICGL
jgi:hypothetical protein